MYTIKLQKLQIMKLFNESQAIVKPYRLELRVAILIFHDTISI